MIELEEDNLKEIISQNPKVIVQYGATWCGSCKIVKPKFKRLSGEHTDTVFAYVDAEKFTQSRSLANLNNLPTFAGFKDGALIAQAAGNKQETITEVLDALASN